MNQPFAIVAKAMAKAGLIAGWGPKRYLQAKRALLELGLIVRVREGLRDATEQTFEPDLFMIASREPKRNPI